MPKHLRVVIGLREWTGTLGPDLTVAQRLRQSHAERTDRIIALAEAGDWPEISDDDIDALAEGWWGNFQLERSKHIIGPGGVPTWPNGRTRLDDINPEQWALSSDDDLTRSIKRFLLGPRRWPYSEAPDAIRVQVETFLGDPKWSAQFMRSANAMSRLRRHCRILHHHAASGYLGQGEDRNTAISRILDLIHTLQIDPQQLVAMLESRSAEIPAPAQSIIDNPVAAPALPAIYPRLPLGHKESSDPEDLISQWAREKGIDSRGVYQARLDMAKFVTLIGNDDATLVIPQHIVSFKEYLVKRGLAVQTINRYLTAVKAPITFAWKDRKIPANPGAGITHQANGRARRRTKRLGYTDEQARVILSAARNETKPHRRWIPWLCALTGCRLDEVAGRDAKDVLRIGTIWVLDIPEGKTDGSARKIPLHSKLITEGFIEDYWSELPKDGPLFPDITDGKYGRAGCATKNIGRWLRQVQKETGVLLVEEPRFAPNHSWRHRFKSETRRAGIEEETHDALTGHREGKVSRDYGEFYVETVLAPAIERMLSPMDIEPRQHNGGDGAEMPHRPTAWPT